MDEPVTATITHATCDPTEIVTGLYRTILRRDPDAVGLAYYADELRAGQSFDDILSRFIGSDEYRERNRRDLLIDLGKSWRPVASSEAMLGAFAPSSLFPIDYRPPGEAALTYRHRRATGFLDRYCSGPVVLDVGFSGYDNPERKTALPHAIGIDLDYPGYDGRTLPFEDSSVDTVFSSHCLEHILFDHAAIQDWYRTLKVGGFVVCIVPSQALYEKRRFLPSRFNEDHKRMYTPATLVRSFEEALAVNSYRVRHLAENDRGFNYAIGPDQHSDGAYEIELVIEKIVPPTWNLA